jgi:hypothetical protein
MTNQPIQGYSATKENGYKAGFTLPTTAPTVKAVPYSEWTNNSSGVGSIPKAPAVVSSKDLTNSFKTESSTLDKTIENSKINLNANTQADPTKKDGTKTETTTTTTKTPSTMPEIMDQEAKDNAAKIEADKVAQKNEYLSQMNNSLANTSQVYKDLLESINRTADNNIAQQKRINDINNSRIKAYALGGSAALATPLEFTNAISLQEQEGAERISKIDNLRNEAIAKAKLAQADGDHDLLKEYNKNISDLQERATTQLKVNADNSLKRYELVRKFADEQAEKQQIVIKENTQRLVTNLASLYFSADDDKKRYDIISKIVEQNDGASFTDVQVAFNKMRTEFEKQQTTDLTQKQKQLAIDKAKRTSSTTKAPIKPTPTGKEVEKYGPDGTLLNKTITKNIYNTPKTETSTNPTAINNKKPSLDEIFK